MISVYRPEKSKVPQFSEQFITLISSFKAKDPVVVLGNLNINLLNVDFTESDFIHTFYSYTRAFLKLL